MTNHQHEVSTIGRPNTHQLIIGQSSEPTEEPVKRGIARWIQNNVDLNLRYDPSEDINDSGFYIAQQVSGVITPEDAGDIYDNHNYENNFRKLNKKGVDVYNSLDYFDPSVCIDPSGTLTIVNGHNRLSRIREENRNIPTAMNVFVLKSKKHINGLWSTIDQAKSRTMSQAVRNAFAEGILDEELLPSTEIVRIASSGANWAMNGFRQGNGKKSPKSHMQLVRSDEFQSFLIDLKKWGFINMGQYTRRLITTGSLASIYSMYMSQYGKCEIFSRQYMSGAGMNENSPVLLVRSYMQNRSKAESGISSTKEQIGKFYSAWTAFINQRDLKILKPKEPNHYLHW